MSIENLKSKLEEEFEENENKKLWKILYLSLKEDSERSLLKETFESARDSQNRIRNRYRDILPFDSTRVKLRDEELSDYINASYVNLENNMYGRRYILTQGPLTSTISHFWKMVWQQNSTCIIMLNKMLEKDTVKCAPYFPESEDDAVDVGNDLDISFVENTVHKSYIKRTFLLKNKVTDECRRIVQFHYQSWPDFGVPSSSEQFLQFLLDIRANGGLNDPEKPAVVHCSAGVGRSGTFVLIDLALLQVEEQQSCQMIDLKEMLLQLRKCRIGLIQAAEQLRFAYISVISGAKIILNIDSEDSTKQINLNPETYEIEPSESLVTSEDEIDSDFSENSNSDSNSALDKAAAAVRTRRGLPPTNCSEGSLIISQNNYNNHEISGSEAVPCQQVGLLDPERKILRENRINRTRQLIDDIRSNMRQRDMQRERILYRLGISGLANTLNRQNPRSLIAGASVVVGILSFACGYIAYKYIG